MKEPIAPSDIKAGDLIRREIGEDAQEWRVGTTWRMPWRPVGDYFLLDRPKIILLSAGTRLRLTRDFYPWSEGDIITLRDDWFEGEDGTTTDGYPSPMKVTADAVVQLPAITSVPASAVEQLRRYIGSFDDIGNTHAKRRIVDFLAAIDEANR